MRKLFLYTIMIGMAALVSSCKVRGSYYGNAETSPEVIYNATQAVLLESVTIFGFARAVDRLNNGAEIEKVYLDAGFFDGYTWSESNDGTLVFTNDQTVFEIERNGNDLYEEGTEWSIRKIYPDYYHGYVYSPVYIVKCTGTKKWTVSQRSDNDLEYPSVSGSCEYLVSLREFPEKIYECDYIIDGKCRFRSADEPDEMSVEADLTEVAFSSRLADLYSEAPIRSGKITAKVYCDGTTDIIESVTETTDDESVIAFNKNGVEIIIRKKI